MSSKTNIFLLGATGYVGGSVASRLLTFPDVTLTAFVRSKEKAAKFNAFGVATIVGSGSDFDKVEHGASEADVVIGCASADDLDLIQAVLRGLKKRHESTGKVPVFIHTSGSGVVVDNAAGMYPTDVIYDDMDVNQMKSIPPTSVHRPVDLAILDADSKGYVRAYLVLPVTIYGFASGPFVDIGIQNKVSIQIPILIKKSLDRGQGGMIGQGKNIWNNVHIDDVADLYIVLLKSLANPTTGHGWNGFYFCENGEHTLYEVGKKISEVLVEFGKGKSLEPTSFSDEEVQKYFSGPWLGTNSRVRANRARSIGWKPVKTREDMLASIKPEVEAILREEKVKG